MNTSSFRIGRDEISLAENIKLLGVTLDKDLNFDKPLALINRAVGLYGRILTEVVSTDRTQ